MKELEKICINCEHFSIWAASPGYSSWTPGSDWSMECHKRHWNWDEYQMDQTTYRDTLRKARTCPDLKFIEETT